MSISQHKTWEECQTLLRRAAYKYRKNLTPEEIYDCKTEAYMQTVNKFRVDGGRTFTSYLCFNMHNRCKDEIRKKISRAKHNELQFQIAHIFHSSYSIHDSCDELLQDMTDIERSIFVFRYCDGMSLRKIAGLLELSTAKVSFHLEHAVDKFIASNSGAYYV